jgi:hypothetical protein
MNVHKHMEAIFVVALVTVGFGSFAIDGMPQASARAPVMRDVAAQGMKQDAAPMAMLCAPRAARRA